MNQQIIGEGKMQDLLKRDEAFRCQLLDRLKSDCIYYLGYGNRNPECLWAGSEKQQIETMECLWNSFPEENKPDWITWEQIKEFEKNMITAHNS
jgi:hypothetical protein